MIPGQELVRRFEEHLKAFKINYVCDKVEEVSKEKDLFKVKTKTKIYWSKTVIIASGKKPRSLKVPGEERLIGKGVIYGNVFDLPFFKDKPIAIVGGGNSALQAVLEASKFTKKIFVIHIASDLTGDEILKDQVKKLAFVKIFNNSRVKAIKGENRVEAVEVENLSTKKVLTIPVEGVVVVIGLEPSLDFKLPKNLKLNKQKEIDVDQNCRTNVAGLFAAGDVTDVKWKQIIIAAGEGAKAALSAYEYLQRKSLMKYH